VRDEQPHVAAGVAVEARFRQQPRVHRGHAHEHGGLGQPAHHRRRIEPVHEQHAAARQQRRVGGHEQAMHVEQRQRMQQDILVAGVALLLEAPELVQHQRVGAQVAVRQHRALAATGGARGVQDGRQVIGAPAHGEERVRKRRSRFEHTAVAPLA